MDLLECVEFVKNHYKNAKVYGYSESTNWFGFEIELPIPEDCLDRVFAITVNKKHTKYVHVNWKNQSKCFQNIYQMKRS